MQLVGIRLQQARVEQKLTLEDISARTRITLKNLAALEADELGKFSSPFLYRSFVRQYAEVVKLDYSSLAADVQAEAFAIRWGAVEPDPSREVEVRIVSSREDLRFSL